MREYLENYEGETVRYQGFIYDTRHENKNTVWVLIKRASIRPYTSEEIFKDDHFWIKLDTKSFYNIQNHRKEIVGVGVVYKYLRTRNTDLGIDYGIKSVESVDFELFNKIFLDLETQIEYLINNCGGNKFPKFMAYLLYYEKGINILSEALTNKRLMMSIRYKYDEVTELVENKKKTIRDLINGYQINGRVKKKINDEIKKIRKKYSRKILLSKNPKVKKGF